MACKCDEAGDYSKCSVHGDNSEYAMRQSIPHTITQTRAELQEQLDSSCRLVERLTEAVKTLAAERDAVKEKLIVINLIAMATNDDAYKVAAIRKVLVDKSAAATFPK